MARFDERPRAGGRWWWEKEEATHECSDRVLGTVVGEW